MSALTSDTVAAAYALRWLLLTGFLITCGALAADAAQRRDTPMLDLRSLRAWLADMYDAARARTHRRALREAQRRHPAGKGRRQ